MKLRLIAQGSSRWDRFRKRWGLSFLLGEDLLFDTFGREDIFRKNLEKFGVAREQIKHVVLSHEDWDHITGFRSLASKERPRPVYLCRDSQPAVKALLRDLGARLIEIDGPAEITEGVFTLGQMPAVTRHGPLTEQALAVRSPRGISVVTGCAHPGILAIVEKAAAFFGKSISTICGGFHMKENSEEENTRILETLRARGVERIVPLHCTGIKACALFRARYGDSCIDLREGGTLEL
ncbi:MAG: MBL fold metallo-hydrolase [Candidatus Omnitrophota bacterium]